MRLVVQEKRPGPIGGGEDVGKAGEGVAHPIRGRARRDGPRLDRNAGDRDLGRPEQTDAVRDGLFERGREAAASEQCVGIFLDSLSQAGVVTVALP
jgi:hypothetical protein